MRKGVMWDLKKIGNGIKSMPYVNQAIHTKATYWV